MIAIGEHRKILVASAPVDFRRGIAAEDGGPLSEREVGGDQY